MHTIVETTKTYKRIAYHAVWRGEHGQAIRDTQGRVWFLTDNDFVRQLFDADIPALQLLGRVDLAAEQRLADGPVLDWIERRNTEQSRKERAA